GRAVSRQRVALERAFSDEGEQDVALADLEENVMTRLLAHDLEAEDRPVEGLRCLNVIDVDRGFGDGFDVQRGGAPSHETRATIIVRSSSAGKPLVNSSRERNTEANNDDA